MVLISIWLMLISFDAPCLPIIGKPSINIFTLWPVIPSMVISAPPNEGSCWKRIFNSLFNTSCSLVACALLFVFFFTDGANLVNGVLYRLRAELSRDHYFLRVVLLSSCSLGRCCCWDGNKQHSANFSRANSIAGAKVFRQRSLIIIVLSSCTQQRCLRQTDDNIIWRRKTIADENADRTNCGWRMPQWLRKKKTTYAIRKTDYWMTKQHG